MKKLILLFLFVSGIAVTFAQNENTALTGWSTNNQLQQKMLSMADISKLKKLNHFKDMVFIEGGVFSNGLTSAKPPRYNPEDSALVYGAKARRISVNSFIISDHEVTNAEYREFVEWVKDSIRQAHPEDPLYCYLKYDNNELFGHGVYNTGLFKYNDILIYPDTLCWLHTNQSYDNSPRYNSSYFYHPAYKNYPVVGVNWHQAIAYCQWKTIRLNQEAVKHKINKTFSLRLPTEAEWQYATYNRVYKIKNQTYTREVNESLPFINQNGKPKSNMGNIIDQNGLVVYTNHLYSYTSNVKSYAPNYYKLYDMLGNVSEWILDSTNASNYLTELPYKMQSDTLNFYHQILEQQNMLPTKAEKIEMLSEMLNNKLLQLNKLSYTENEDLIQKYIMEYNVLMQIRTELICNNPDSRIVKGGSWEDGAIYQQINSIDVVNSWDSKSSIGFRVAMSLEYK